MKNAERREILETKKTKTYSHLFKSVIQDPEKSYYHNFFSIYKNSSKRLWVTLKEMVDSKRSSRISFPKLLVVNKVEMFDKKLLQKILISEIIPKLAS